MLGETWVNHHGNHGKESQRGIINLAMKDHPIVRGVEDIWGPTDVYTVTHLPADGTCDVGAINGAFMMVRREVLERVGLFDESFFMYGDDLDLCLRMGRAGYRVVYDGRVQMTHLKGLSVGKDYDRMARAIFDANREVFLKHFNPRDSKLVRWKYRLAFSAWKRLALLKAKLSGRRRVKPL